MLPAVLVLERLLQQSPPAAGLCRPLVSVPLLRTVRALCIAQGPCFSDPLKAKRPVQPDPVLLPLARLLSSLLSGPEPPPSEAFVVQLLSLPLFVPLSGLALGPHLAALVSATQRLLQPSLDAALPASPCPSAPSSLWLTANLCAILSTRVRGSSRRQLLETVTSGLLQSTLSLLVELVGRLPPAALSDREVISLEKKGTHIETLVSRPHGQQAMKPGRGCLLTEGRLLVSCRAGGGPGGGGAGAERGAGGRAAGPVKGRHGRVQTLRAAGQTPADVPYQGPIARSDVYS